MMAALCLFWWICVFWRGHATQPVCCLDLPLLLGCAHGKSLLCLFLYVCCVCVQDKREVMDAFWRSMNNSAAAKAVTVPQLLTVTACLSIDDEWAVRHFSWGFYLVAQYVEASGCDVIMSAGCIPHVIDCLRRWPADRNVVSNVCDALTKLAQKGSASVRTAIKSVPDIQATLQAAKESGLDNGCAARALSALGL
jgi:hypothetical protein